jgi:1,4-alpha-glucan branching enzyme
MDHRYEGIIAYKRKGKHRADDMVIVLNVSKNNYPEWKLQLKGKTSWNEVYNSNNISYWGNGEYVNAGLTINLVDKKKKLYEINFAIPALSAVIFQ